MIGSPVQQLIPPHEKRILEAHVRGVALSRLALDERPLNEYEQEELKTLIRMRMRGMPLQYLVSSQGFYGREFYVNTSVLIPRPETEGLVELALKLLPSAVPGRTYLGLDFGTGSGCIALTLAQERRDLLMTAAECMGEALKVAEENAKRHRVSNIVFSTVSEVPALWQFDDLQPLDLIVSNPPYLVSSDDIADDVREHEPSEALFAPEEDPLVYYRFLSELMDHRLADGGFGVFEIAEQRGAETAALFETKNYVTELHKDLTGRDRYLLVRRPHVESK